MEKYRLQRDTSAARIFFLRSFRVPQRADF